MMSEDENSIQEPSIKLDSSDERAPTGRVSIRDIFQFVIPNHYNYNIVEIIITRIM